jgi:hypothetical protein
VILKRKQDSRSKGLSNPAQCQADNPRAWGGRSAGTRRTVCYPRADSLLIATERPDSHPNTRTICTWSSDGPRATGAARTVHDPQVDSPTPMQTIRYPYADSPIDPFRQETVGQMDRNEGAEEHVINLKNPRPKSFARTVRGL